MISKTLKIAAAYIRVSTDDQTELSPDSQVKKIQEYAKAHGYVVPDEYIFHDDGISGRTTKKRQGFNKMIATAKTDPKPFDAILVWKFSRFARNREDSIVFKSMLKKRGIDVISISEAVGDDKMSILIESLIEAMDEYYSVNLSEEVVRGMTEKVSRGQAVSVPPLGYKIENGQFFIDEEIAPIVREIFKNYLDGKGCREIAMQLNAKGYKTRRGNKFENRTVQYIIDNPVYAGYIRWDIDGRGARSYYRDGKEMIVKGTHEPLIDPETYEKVKSLRVLEKATAKKYERKTPVVNDFALRGLVRCSNCGGTLCMSSTGKSLQCYKYAHGSCSVSHNISLNKINDALLYTLKEDIHNTNLNITETENNIIVSVDYDKKIKREEEKLIRIKEAYQSGIDTLEEYKANKERIYSTIQALQHEKNEELKKAPKKTTTELKNKIRNAVELLSSPDATERAKNEALKSFIDKIVFDRKASQITIFYFL